MRFRGPFKEDIAVDIEVDVDIDRYFGCLQVVSKPVQARLYGIEAIGTDFDNWKLASPLNSGSL